MTADEEGPLRPEPSLSEVIGALREASLELGGVSPTASWWHRQRRRPTYEQITRAVGGSWDVALVAAGLPPVRRARTTTPATREDVIAALRDAAAELGASPTMTWWQAERRAPTYETILRLFGRGWSQALRAAGLPPPPRRAASSEDSRRVGDRPGDGDRPPRRASPTPRAADGGPGAPWSPDPRASVARGLVRRWADALDAAGPEGDTGGSIPDVGDRDLDPSSHTDPIASLPISLRTANALRRAGIHTVEALQARGDALMAVRGLGARSLEEIAAALRDAPAPACGTPTGDATELPGSGVTSDDPGRRDQDTPVRRPPADRTRTMVELRLQGRTLEEIGARFDVTRERVRQILGAEGIGAERAVAVRRARVEAARSLEHARILARFRQGEEMTDIAAMTGQPLPRVRAAIRAGATAADHRARAEALHGPRLMYSDEDLVEAVRHVATEIGDVPTGTAYQQHARRLGLPSLPTVVNRLGGWSGALRAAGMAPHTTPRRYTRRWSTDACWRALRNLTAALGGPPRSQQYELLAAGDDDLPSLQTVRNRLGPWSVVVSRLLVGQDHPVLGRLGVAPATPADEREERILLAFLAEEVSDDELASLARDGLFTWRDAYGEPPPGLDGD